MEPQLTQPPLPRAPAVGSNTPRCQLPLAGGTRSPGADGASSGAGKGPVSTVKRAQSRESFWSTGPRGPAPSQHFSLTRLWSPRLVWHGGDSKSCPDLTETGTVFFKLVAKQSFVFLVPQASPRQPSRAVQNHHRASQGLYFLGRRDRIHWSHLNDSASGSKDSFKGSAHPQLPAGLKQGQQERAAGWLWTQKGWCQLPGDRRSLFLFERA